MRYIDKDEVIFDPASTVDSFGRVFHYGSEVYRAINPDAEPLCNALLKKANKWGKYGLVKTRNSPIYLKDYPVTIWHEKIEYKNYCLEWIPEMLKDAAVQFLKLNFQLMRDGYICKDAHPWNMFFRGIKPVFIDIGSIIPFTEETFRNYMHEFRLYFWLPLVMFAKEGHEKTYDFLNLPIPNHQFRNKLANEMGLPSYVSPKFLPERFGIKRLIKIISEVDTEIKKPTEWSNYDQKEIPIDRLDDFNMKQKVVYEFLLPNSKGSMLDIGCNKGWFSRLANRLGFEVIAIDNDIPALTDLYKMVKRDGLNILTLYIDFSKPTKSHGLNNGYPAFEERISCDIVLAMAMVHHLVYKAKMTFEEIAKRVSKIARKYAIVEFIPKEDYYVSKWDNRGMEWYQRNCFIEAFMKEFKTYRVFPSSPAPREIFIFEK